MSFQSSARTVRDASRPLGYRVRAFYQCIEFFPPFGFNATREQLRRVLGATGGQWTEAQLLHGVDLLEQARRSWVAARDGADVRTHRPVSHYNRPPPEGGVPYVTWLMTWLGEDGNAERWGVAHLGACPECRHPRVLHWRHGWCLGDMTGAGPGWSCWCRRPSPLLDPEEPADPRTARRCRTALAAAWRGCGARQRRRP